MYMIQCFDWLFFKFGYENYFQNVMIVRPSMKCCGQCYGNHHFVTVCRGIQSDTYGILVVIVSTFGIGFFVGDLDCKIRSQEGILFSEDQVSLHFFFFAGRGHCGRDRMVVGFATTCTYHH